MNELNLHQAVAAVIGKHFAELEKFGIQSFMIEEDDKYVDGGVEVTFFGPFTYKMGEREISYPVYNLAGFTLAQVPGCCAILVSTGAAVHGTQGKGLGQFLLSLREEVAKLSGYTMLMATTNQNNAAENHILEKHGFKRYEQFQSVRTKNTVNVWMKQVAEVK